MPQEDQGSVNSARSKWAHLCAGKEKPRLVLPASYRNRLRVIEAERKRRGITKRTVARAVGYTPEWVTEVLNGRKYSEPAVARVEEALGLCASWTRASSEEGEA